MRGQSDHGDALFSCVQLEERAPADHPLRAIRALTDEVLVTLSAWLEVLRARGGRPSIPPEMMLRATLLQTFFSIRSERMLMEQINCDRPFRWFVGLSMDADVRHPTGFTHDLDRLLEADVARDVMVGLTSLPKVRRLMSGEDFSVAGTLIDAWASMKSFRPKVGSGDPPQPGRKTAIDRRTAHHPGYGFRQRGRKRIEEAFGWIKAPAGFAKVKLGGRPKVAAVFGFAILAYDSVRPPKLLAEAAT